LISKTYEDAMVDEKADIEDVVMISAMILWMI